MEELHFRIVLVPSENFLSDDEMKTAIDSHMTRLKILVVKCGLTDVNVSFLKVKKSEDEEFHEIEEFTFQVQAKYNFSGSKRHSSFYYREFCIKWKELFYESPSPILVFYENSSFKKTNNSSHCSITCSNIAFGVLPHDGKFHQYASLRHSADVDFYHDIRFVKIIYNGFELNFTYSNIRNIFINIGSSEVFFDLCNPPLIFKVTHRSHRYGSYDINERTAFICNNSLLAVKQPEVDVDVFGRSSVLRMTLTDSTTAQDIVDRIHFRCSEKPVHYVHVLPVSVSKPYDPRIDFGSNFGCIYLLTAIFKRNFITAAQTKNMAASLSKLEKFCSENAHSLEKALTIVLAAIDAGKIVNFWHSIEKQYYYYLENEDEVNFSHYIVPEKCKMIRRITLTPTRQQLWAPEIMFGNRVFRNYDSEYALRVSFKDDNNSRLSFNAAYAHENVFDLAIRKPLSKGIIIGSRTYEFLAWSNSQIRDHGIWMYARDTMGNSVREIRSWMGDFSHIHSVPKYMARMGQCFSQTEDAVSVPLDTSHVRTESDVEGGFDSSNGKLYCFSDGVGKISVELANKVRDVLGHDKLCSAFQIRYGGYKGMLVIDPTLKDTDIVFRESMKKFNSPKNIRLEIAKTSAPIRLQLNRPFITILNDMGVRHRTFLKLQEEMLRTLTDMLFDEEKAAAFLESKTPSDLFSYKDLSHSGVFLTTEPFFRSLLLALHRHHVDKIKTRANIAIDPSKGRNMLGVMDETGLLHYGEVFVQYTKEITYGETNRETVILKREVLVTKNPCLLPGDVRKFHAVDIPQLHHIVDCIVFPQRGDRPHPNEMAGSDLDGDEYAVLWNDDLIFHKSNQKPGQFPSAVQSETNNITQTDMINFLVEYIRNDQVGAIANAHLAHADDESIFSDICIDIAKKFSYAVDFAKTGVSKHLERPERPTMFPDFMEKNYKETYTSKKALGKMFRVACDYESENENASIAYQNIQMDNDLVFPGWEKYKQDAVRSRNKFNTLLKAFLRNYGIQHEAEAFSGAFTNLHCRFQERKDRDEIEKVILRCIKRLCKSLNDEFFEEFSKSANVKNIDVPILQKASAWYIVTYEDKNAKFLSFPWTVSKLLANIKIRKVEINPLYFSPIVEQMDEQIRVCESKILLPYIQESEVWHEYYFLCDSMIVKLALRVLLLWAQDEGIVDKAGCDVIGFMYVSTFVKLVFHVAENVKYVVKNGKAIPSIKGKHFSAAALCLEFFRFCLTLRFYNQKEVKEVVPFQLYKYSKLSKRAVVAYHRFALLGKFQTIYFDLNVEENSIQMKPISIDSKIFPRLPINPVSLKKAEDALVKYSGIEEVSLREIRQTKKVVVYATGSEQALKCLKGLLRKKHVFLTRFFTTGVLPTDP